jgi:hypothetical protein
MIDHVDQIINDVVAGAGTGTIPYTISEEYNDPENCNMSSSSVNTNNMILSTKIYISAPELSCIEGSVIILLIQIYLM